MLAMLARGMFLLFLAVMLVTWALTVTKTEPAQPEHGTVTFYLVA